MKNRLHKRLSAWLLTLVMLVGMLPAMASADEVGEDLAPPAPQEENYGYVRLLFAEGEQLDLCHGEYITECSPTAEILSGADEDFIFNGEYAALYYEGKLYCKAALEKAAELGLIDGYCIGDLSAQQMRIWLSETTEAMKAAARPLQL